MTYRCKNNVYKYSKVNPNRAMFELASIVKYFSRQFIRTYHYSRKLNINSTSSKLIYSVMLSDTYYKQGLIEMSYQPREIHV